MHVEMRPLVEIFTVAFARIRGKCRGRLTGCGSLQKVVFKENIAVE